jgi:hypothetical protein
MARDTQADGSTPGFGMHTTAVLKARQEADVREKAQLNSGAEEVIDILTAFVANRADLVTPEEVRRFISTEFEALTDREQMEAKGKPKISITIKPREETAGEPRFGQVTRAIHDVGAILNGNATSSNRLAYSLNPANTENGGIVIRGHSLSKIKEAVEGKITPLIEREAPAGYTADVNLARTEQLRETGRAPAR